MSLNVKVKNSKTGEEVEGLVVKVTKADEPFSHITLEDGTEISMRTNVTQVIRLVDRWDEKGNPVYSIEANGSTVINTPDNLKRKPEDEK